LDWKVTTALFPLIGSILIFSQSQMKAQCNATNKVDFKSVLSIGYLFGHELLQVGGAVEDHAGNIYVSDKLDCSVKKFTRTGKFVGKYGRYGKKKGELKGPIDLAIWKDKIAIVDYLSTAVQIIGTDLNYVRTVHAPNFVADIAFDSRGRLYVACASDQKNELLTLFDIEGKAIRNINSLSIRDNIVLNSIQISVTPSDELVVMYQFFNAVELFDSDGKFVQVLTVPYLPTSAEMRSQDAERTLPAGGLLLGVCTDSQSRIWILGGAYSKNPNRDVYILSKGGRPTETMTLPKPVGTIVSARNNHIIVREEKRTRVTKYQLVFDKRE
jgi:hypothetical protein